jgi:chloride channel protein, CIC family
LRPRYGRSCTASAVGAASTDLSHNPSAGPGCHPSAESEPQAVLAGESLAQTLRQLDAYGRDGLPVLSSDGQQVQGWITNVSVLQAVAREIGSSPPQTLPAQASRESRRSPRAAAPEPPTPLPGYQVVDVTVEAGSPASGRALGALTWPPGYLPVSVLHHRSLQEPDPGRILAPGDRISLLAPASGRLRF